MPATSSCERGVATPPAFACSATNPPAGSDPASSVVDRDALEHAFGALTPDQRAVVVIHHYLGYPLTEIAATAGHPRRDCAVPSPLRGPSVAGRARFERSGHRDATGAIRMTGNANPSFDSRIADWLEAGPDDAPAAVLDTVLAATPSIPQRRGLARWRSPRMTIATRLATAMIVAVVALGGIFSILGPRLRPNGPVPSATPVASTVCEMTPFAGLVLSAGCSYHPTELGLAITIAGTGNFHTGPLAMASNSAGSMPRGGARSRFSSCAQFRIRHASRPEIPRRIRRPRPWQRFWIGFGRVRSANSTPRQ